MKYKGRVLVACEYSGTVRDAFSEQGWDAWSCDILPTHAPGNHIMGDCLKAIWESDWDLLIAHPPCTYLTVANNQKWHLHRQQQEDAIQLVWQLLMAPVEHIALENPVGILTKQVYKYTQMIHPWQFGHYEQKRTCLWLKNLPPLVETDNVFEETMSRHYLARQRLQHLSPSVLRGLERSKTYSGIAAAMAQQWTQYLYP